MKKYFPLILLSGVHLFFLYHLRFTAWPEMFSFPYLYNSGFNLYQDMVHVYPPLLTLILAKLYLLFGYKLIVLQVFTWLLILANDILIYAISHKFTKSSKLSAISLLSYIFIQPSLEGNMLWFDLAFVPFILAGIFLSFKGFSFKAQKRNNMLMAAGLAFTLAGLIKQNAFIFLVIEFFWMLFTKEYRATIKYFLFAPLFIGFVFILKLYSIGTLKHFLDWNLIYPATFWSNFPGYVDMVLTRKELVIIFLLLLPFLLFYRKLLAEKSVQLLSLFFIGSLLTIYPRFSFFHMQMAISLISIFYSIIFLKASRPLRVLTLLAFFVLLATGVSTVRNDWRKTARFLSQEDINLYDKMNSYVEKDETIYLLGPNSYFYVFSNTYPPKPWLDNYGWYFEVPGVQENVIGSWQKDPPSTIFISEKEEGNWYDLGTYYPSDIIAWISNNYIEIDKIDGNLSVFKRI